MINLSESKYLGVVVFVIIFTALVASNGVSVFAQTMQSKPQAQNCKITSTLKLGSTGNQVKCLQSDLGITANGTFGAATESAVKDFQTRNGLTADGIFGPSSLSAWKKVGASSRPSSPTKKS